MGELIARQLEETWKPSSATPMHAQGSKVKFGLYIKSDLVDVQPFAMYSLHLHVNNKHLHKNHVKCCLLQWMVVILPGASGQNAQRLVAEERKCALGPARTLRPRTEGRLVWIRVWDQKWKLRRAICSHVQVSSSCTAHDLELQACKLYLSVSRSFVRPGTSFDLTV